ncbi:hypothetical protein P22_0633 [Propionispora sp. 2/2-37]|uniref:hypothetical protein n=1 Tax=Propionispora sp. 2/2-37 TaxID=1677858 RepID=UPI0006BB7896|nr:hypothetical protein [Propionispora sp. 2/2-37]CUH94567.1 hypothetical protein P22_0633 [Propionispora sp. 2/2-37]
MVQQVQDFYTVSPLPVTAEHVLAGRIVRINPALVTLLDGRLDTTPVRQLQDEVFLQVRKLLQQKKIKTFHVDINVSDYSGFGNNRPGDNTAVFDPDFLAELNREIRRCDGYLNVHFLTNDPLKQLEQYRKLEECAICYQLEVLADDAVHRRLLRLIERQGSCASPVLEIFGPGNSAAVPRKKTYATIKPFFSELAMLTFQAEQTAARSTSAQGALATQPVREYISFFRRQFSGAIQIQGGVKRATIAAAAALGADFLVCGTDIFRSREHSPEEMVDILLEDMLPGCLGRLDQ